MSKKRRKSKRPTALPEAKGASQPSAESSPRGEAGLSLALAAAMAVLIVARPWRDGYAFPLSNYYFLWVSAGLFVLWAGSVVLYAGRFAHWRASSLLGLFLLLAVLTGFDTIQQDGTLRALLNWASAALIFLVAANGLRTRASVLVVAGAFIAAMFIEAGYGAIHLKYLLPITRQSLLRDPTQLQTIFNVSQLTPELAHRINVNRAFGHFLFPNALAAFMVLGVPVAVSGAVLAIGRLRALRRGAEPPSERMQYAFMAGLACWAVLIAPALIAIFRLGFDVAAGAEGVASLRNWVVWVLGVPAATGLSAGLVIYHRRKSLPPRRQQTVLTGLTAWAVTLGAAFVVYSFHFLSRFEYAAWRERPMGWLFWAGLLPLGAALAIGWITAVKGAARAWYWALSVLLCLASALGLYTLWLTFSRGGAMGLFLATLWCGGLLLWRKRRGGAPSASGKAARAALVTLGALLLAAAGAQEEGIGLGTPPEQDARTQTAAPGEPGIAVQGEDLDLADAANPTSLKLRLSYWRTGMRMFADHALTGVGLGNFGVAYPVYQYLGAGDVQAAHNDYIQVLCETGVFGFAAFAAFWGYFIYAGARRILREPDGRRLWLFTGLYAGAAAFLAHSLVDFNFYNPSLLWLQFALAGTALAAGSTQQRASRAVMGHQVAAIPCIVLASVAAGFGAKVWAAERFQGPDNLVTARINAAARLMEAGPHFNPERLPTWQGMYAMVGDFEALEAVCSLWEPMGGARRGISALRSRAGDTPDKSDRVMVRDPWPLRKSMWDNRPELMKAIRRGKPLFTTEHGAHRMPASEVLETYEIPLATARRFGGFYVKTGDGLTPLPEGQPPASRDVFVVENQRAALQAVYRHAGDRLPNIRVLDAIWNGTPQPWQAPRYAVISELAPRDAEGLPSPDFIERLNEFAALWRAEPLENRRVLLRRLEPDEQPVPGDFLIIRSVPRARRAAQEFAQHWIDRLKRADDLVQAQLAGLADMAPETARLLFEWYDVLAGATADSENYREYVLSALRWAEAFYERSPWDARASQYLGKSLWRRGNLEGADGRMAYYEQGLDAYRRAAELYPTSPLYAAQYAEALERFGAALIERGRAGERPAERTRGEAYLERSREWAERAAGLREAQALPLQEKLAL